MGQETITELIVKNMVSEFTKAVINELKPALKGIKDEIKHVFDDGLYEYLEKEKERFSYIKTVLHMEKPIFIYDTYQPLKLSAKSGSIEISSIEDIFKENNCVTILGEAGSGKSTLVKHLFLSTIYENYRIPIIIELRDLNDSSKELSEFIKEKILNNELSPNLKIVDRLLQNGMFVFFFDGYDEIKTAIKEKTIKSLNKFVNDYSDNKYVVTSRPLSNVESLPSFFNYHVMNLSDTDIENFVKREVEEVTCIKIQKAIKENNNVHIKNFLKNPMLLSLFILTFQSYPNIPEKIDVFYGRVVDVLFYKHDSWTKPGFDREMCSNLNQEEYINVLKRFSFLSYFEEKYEFENDYICQKLNIIKSKLINLKFENRNFIKDLEVGVCLWVEDCGKISFSHRSLQEYFAALYIRDLTNDQKRQVYTKMKDGSLKKLIETDWKNFTILCENIDKINYYDYFLVPILQDLYDKINIKDYELRNRTFLESFFRGYIGVERISEDNFKIRSIGRGSEGAFYQTIIELHYFTIKIVRDFLNESKVIDILNKKYSENKERYEQDGVFNQNRIPITLHFDSTIIKLFNNETTNNTINELLAYLDKRIKLAKNEINQSQEAENSFIELI